MLSPFSAGTMLWSCLSFRTPPSLLCSWSHFLLFFAAIEPLSHCSISLFRRGDEQQEIRKSSPLHSKGVKGKKKHLQSSSGEKKKHKGPLKAAKKVCSSPSLHLFPTFLLLLLFSFFFGHFYTSITSLRSSSQPSKRTV